MVLDKIFKVEQEIETFRKSQYPKDFPIKEKKAYLKGLKEGAFLVNYINKLKQDMKDLEAEIKNLKNQLLAPEIKIKTGWV